MNIQPVTSTASKAEELAALEKIVKKTFQPGTYINDLFNDRFMTWIEEALKNDFTPDIFIYIDGLNDDARRYMSQATRAQAELTAANRDHARQLAEITRNTERAAAFMQDRIDSLEKSVNYWRDEANETYTKLRDAQNAADSAAEAADAATQENARLLTELNALKASLYDAQKQTLAPYTPRPVME